jgi:hypothetical protein
MGVDPHGADAAVAVDTPTKRQRSPTRNGRIITSIGEER